MMSSELVEGGKTETSKRGEEYEYVEVVLQMPATGKVPTKATRKYKVAKTTEGKAKEWQPLSVEGKTVQIEKGAAGYDFTVDGRKLTYPDKAQLARTFRDNKKDEYGYIPPKQAVKVGESWTLTADDIKDMTGMGGNLDMSKTTQSCKLTRAYMRDSKQWGQITFVFDVGADLSKGAAPGTTGTGTMTLEGTLDVVIDGSARDMELKAVLKTSLDRTKDGVRQKGTSDATILKSVRTVR